MKIKISEKLSWKNFFLASIGNAYTFNLKNHLVLKLKYPSIKDWRSINWRVWKKGPPLGLIGLKNISVDALFWLGHLNLIKYHSNLKCNCWKEAKIRNLCLFCPLFCRICRICALLTVHYTKLYSSVLNQIDFYLYAIEYLCLRKTNI